MALLKNPLDCVTSRASSNPHMIGALFRQWLRFLRAIHPGGNAVIIGRFEMVTADPADFIRYIKWRSGTAFSDTLLQEEAVFRPMDESFSECFGARRHNHYRPRSERECLKREIGPGVVEHERAPAAPALHDALSPVPGSGVARSLAGVPWCIGAPGVCPSLGQR